MRAFRVLPSFCTGRSTRKVGASEIECHENAGVTPKTISQRKQMLDSNVLLAELESKYDTNNVLNIYDLPPAFSTHFMILYDIPSFRKKFEESLQNCVMKATQIIDNMIERNYTLAVSLVEMNCFMSVASDCLIIHFANSTESHCSSDSNEIDTNTEFQKFCKSQIGMLTQTCISTQNMLKAFQHRIETYTLLMRNCWKTCKEDYSSKGMPKAKLLFKHFKAGENYELNFQTVNNLPLPFLGSIEVGSVVHKNSEFVILCKEGQHPGSSSRWVYGSHIPIVTLSELVKLGVRESHERIGVVHTRLARSMEDVINNKIFDVGVVERCETLPIVTDQLVRLLQFREMPLDLEATSLMLFSFMKFRKRFEQLAVLLTKIHRILGNILTLLIQIQKTTKEKAKRLKGKIEFQGSKNSDPNPSLPVTLHLVSQWPEILNDFVIAPIGPCPKCKIEENKNL